MDLQSSSAMTFDLPWSLQTFKEKIILSDDKEISL